MAGKKKEPDQTEGVLQNKESIKDKKSLFGGHRIQPGQVLNPGGRPKMAKTVRALAREHTEVSIRRLASIVQNDKSSPSAQVQAATALLDRGWGKPLQQLEVGDAGAFSEMSEAELDRYIVEATARLAALAPSNDEDHAVH